MLFAFDADAWRAASASVLLYLPRVSLAVVLLLVFWIGASTSQRVIQRAGKNRKVAGDALFIFARTAYVGLLAVGLITSLGTIGVDITALVTGLGLTGFAVGFALKDIISNSMSGILILVYKPFHRTDRIAVVFPPTTFEGHVVHIDLRYTTLELPDRKILIPNSILFTNPITVFRSAENAPAAVVNVAPQ